MAPYSANFNQKLYTETVNYDEIGDLFPTNIEYTLRKNYRNSYQILSFVQSFLPEFAIDQKSLNELKNNPMKNGSKPKLFMSSTEDEEIEKIIKLIELNKSEIDNIAILLPFGDNRYDEEQSVNKYYDILMKHGLKCSKYHTHMSTSKVDISNIHVTTYKSAKGLEFDTVLIPQFNKYSINIEKSTTTNKEDYYVAITRTKRNLYLFSNEELDFIDTSTCDIEGI